MLSTGLIHSLIAIRSLILRFRGRNKFQFSEGSSLSPHGCSQRNSSPVDYHFFGKKKFTEVVYKVQTRSCQKSFSRLEGALVPKQIPPHLPFLIVRFLILERWTLSLLGAGNFRQLQWVSYVPTGTMAFASLQRTVFLLQASATDTLAIFCF